MNMSKLHQIQKAMEMIGLQPGAGAPNAPKSIEEAQRKTYQFWDTQPVPKLCKVSCTVLYLHVVIVFIEKQRNEKIIMSYMNPPHHNL